MNDDQLQEWLDKYRYLPEKHGEEDELYPPLLKALGSQPTGLLSPGFAHRVTARLDHQAARSDRPLYVMIILSGLVLCVFAMAALAYFAGIPDVNLPAPAKPVIYLTGIVLLLAFLYHRLEKKLLFRQ